MSSLYTVEVQRKQRITRYDAKGKPTVSETMITETYTDMPAATASMYERTCEPGTVKITKQYAEIGTKSRVSVAGDQHGRRTDIETGSFGGTATKKVVQPAPKQTAGKGSIGDAKPKAPKPVATDDYASVVNKMMENAR